MACLLREAKRDRGRAVQSRLQRPRCRNRAASGGLTRRTSPPGARHDRDLRRDRHRRRHRRTTPTAVGAAGSPGRRHPAGEGRAFAPPAAASRPCARTPSRRATGAATRADRLRGAVEDEPIKATLYALGVGVRDRHAAAPLDRVRTVRSPGARSASARMAASDTNGLLRRSSPKVEIGPWPGTKVTSSPSGQSLVDDGVQQGRRGRCAGSRCGRSSPGTARRRPGRSAPRG